MKQRTGVTTHRPGEVTRTGSSQWPLAHRPLGSAEQPASAVLVEREQRPLGSIDPPFSQFAKESLTAGWLPSSPNGSMLPPFLPQKVARAPRSCPKTPRTSWATVGAVRCAARFRSSEAEAHEQLTRVHPRTRATTTRRNDRLDMTAAPFGDGRFHGFKAGPAPHWDMLPLDVPEITP